VDYLRGGEHNFANLIFIPYFIFKAVAPVDYQYLEQFGAAFL
jgi:hypothetical protein